MCIFFLGLHVTGQTNYSIDAIQDSLVIQLSCYPQEKIHLHTDRAFYIPGEKVWFKAYLVDAFSHQSLTNSLYIYVELIDSTQTIKKRVMVRRGDDMMYYGHLPVPETIRSGTYTIRAYTRYMENLGDDYFFKKNIFIRENRRNEENSTIWESLVIESKSIDDYHVSLLPEGGNLLAGVFCKVAFKAQHINGYSEYITGEVVDDKGELINSVKTVYAGMGSFVFVPEKDKKYYLRSKNRNGLEKTFELPAVASTYSIFANFRNNNHLITVEKSADCPEKPLFLLIQSRGIPLSFEAWGNQKKLTSIPSDQLPSGIIQFILFDGDMNPLSERLVFNKSNDQAEVIFTTDQPVYGRREKVQVELTVSDAEGTVFEGNLSVSITDDKDTDPDSRTTILSSLLLASDLKGYIENPAYYLQDNAESLLARDLLMLTHGWRRYNIPEAIKGAYEFPKIAFEQSKGISGTVTSRVLKRPVKGSNVTFVTNDGSFGILETDSAGRFAMYGLDYPDSTRIILQAKNTNEKDNVNLDVDKEKFPKSVYAPNSPFLMSLESEKGHEFAEKASQWVIYYEDMRLIELDEVVITFYKPKNDPVLDYYSKAKPDFTINKEAIEQYDQKNVELLIMKLPGVMGTMKSGVIDLKLSGSKYPPVVIIDDVQQSWFEDMSPFSNIRSTDDIKEIYVIGGGQTALFGTGPESPFQKRLLFNKLEEIGIIGPSAIGDADYWGDNGAIIINTFEGNAGVFVRRRHFNNVSIEPLGYQTRAAFYAPRYETPNTKTTGIPDYRTTIFWKPDLVISKDGKVTFDFYTADFPTTYSVVIEGLSANGKIVRKVEKIYIK